MILVISSTPAGHSGLRLADAFPTLSPDERKAKVTAAIKWVKACPLASRPLVPSSVKMVTDDGLRAVQQAMPVLVSWLRWLAAWAQWGS